MTTTDPVPVPPALNEPLMTLEELAVWVQEPDGIPVEEQDLAWKIIEGASVVVREAGSSWWCPADTDPLPDGWIKIPYRAKLLLDLKVKNFYEHRDGAISETTGPLSSRYLDDVVAQLQLTDTEKELLATLAADGGDPSDMSTVSGIWALSTFRGSLETHNGPVTGVICVPWWRPYWPLDAPNGSLPYYVEGAFGSPTS